MEASTEFADIPAQLVRAAASGRLCVVLGPHLVAGSGFPTPHQLWQTVFDRALQQAPPTRFDDLEEARVLFAEPGNHRDKVALLTTLLGDAFVDGSIIAALRGIHATPSPLHRALAKLPTLFLTTCPDDLIQRARVELGLACSTTLLDDGDDVRLPAIGDVLALGGTSYKSGVLPFARPPSPLTERHRDRLQKVLERTSAVLLVGFAPHDDELLAVLDLLAAAHLTNPPRRYWLAARDARVRARAAAFHIEPLWLPPARDPEAFVHALAKRIENQNAPRPSLWPLPDNTPDDIRSALTEGHAALALADLASAAEHGLFVYDKSNPKEQPQLVLEALALLYFALRRTLFEDPPDAALIPVEHRGHVLDMLEKGLGALERAPDPWRKHVTRLADRLDSITIYALSEDTPHPTAAEATEADATSLFDFPDEHGIHRSFELVQAGHAEEALAQVPAFDHPWKGALVRALFLWLDNQVERALVLLQELFGSFQTAPNWMALPHTCCRSAGVM